MSMDNGTPPKYFAGRDDLAAALGKSLPGKPEDFDSSPEAEAARKQRASVYEIVRKAVARLVKEGVIVSSGDARFRNRAEYSLHLMPKKLTQQSVAPGSNESLPQQTQQSIGSMPQQNVAPMPQQIVATAPTERCPLGVEEPLKEQLIGIHVGANPDEAAGSPAHIEEPQSEKEIDLPAELPSSKASVARQQEQDFKDWYEAYPRHVGRGAALNAYRKARKSGVGAEALLAGARRYSLERKGQDPQYTKMPATWLNQECWADDPNHTGETDVEAILGKDFWSPGTPPEGLSVGEEIEWKKDQRAIRNAERLEEAKAKQAARTGPWSAEYHRPNVPPQYAWANRPDHGDRALAKGAALMAAHDARQGAASGWAQGGQQYLDGSERQLQRGYELRLRTQAEEEAQRPQAVFEQKAIDQQNTATGTAEIEDESA
ncbi:hypothetical protein ACLRGI_10325 [Paenarthrobacter nitroguajacolicus]|uniref:hypothetical protein n=1 Tax=Paenarthrobacter nitroguajacolicus TaxID=211146 RepID=UPI003ADDCB63